MRISVTAKIFEKFPDLTIGIVAAESINNISRTMTNELTGILKTTEDEIRRQFKDKPLSQHPSIQAWRQAYKAFKAGDYRSSVENLTKRVINGGSLPSINNLVDCYNIISLRYTLPVGGEDLDRVSGDIILTEATGTEEFIPLL